jgi:hypothetical protein
MIDEFGFSATKLLALRDNLNDIAIQSGKSWNRVDEKGMLLLLDLSEFGITEAEAFFNTFTLPIRAGWDKDLPPGCRKEDVFPWRFRRKLSLFARPLIQLNEAGAARHWFVSATAFDRAISHMMSHISSAHFPSEYFKSKAMKKHVGEIANERGHAFSSEVHSLFTSFQLETRHEFQMSRFNVKELGDIDVAAADSDGRVFIVECKRLLPALTMREIVQRLEDFKGDKTEVDSLGRHLRRVDWLNAHKNLLASEFSLRQVTIIPILLTSELMPMRFYTKINFPLDQVISFDELESTLIDKYKLKKKSP